jgi:hypothetical protein
MQYMLFGSFSYKVLLAYAVANQADLAVLACPAQVGLCLGFPAERWDVCDTRDTNRIALTCVNMITR